MASIIRVKRSTGTSAPGTLNFGELGLTVGVGTHGNKGGRVFAGDNSSNPQEIGGRYFTDLLSIEPGKVAGQQNPSTFANGFVPILDGDRKVDLWNVDNLSMDGNTLASTNTDGNIVLNPNGTGVVAIPDDTFLTFGDSADSQIEYDEDNTDRIQVTGANWRYNLQIEVNELSVVGVSTLNSSGGITTTGGDLYVGGDLFVQDDTNIDELTARNLNVTGIATVQDKLHLLDNDVVHFGGSLGDNGDTNIHHDGSNTYIHHSGTGSLIARVVNRAFRVYGDANASIANFIDNGAVELYHNNNKKFETTSSGVDVTGTITMDAVPGTNTNAALPVLFQTSAGVIDGGSQLTYNPGGDVLKVNGLTLSSSQVRTSGNTALQLTTANANGTVDLIVRTTHVECNGNLLPATNNTDDLGSTSLRWRNVYTNDLNLSNEGKTNDVDGTWGSYTIQEGEDDLFLINKRSGKKYKFNLTEVS